MINYNIKTSDNGTARHNWEKGGYELVIILRPGNDTLFQVDSQDNDIELGLDGMADEPVIKINLASAGVVDPTAAVEFAAQVQKAAETANQFQQIINSFM